MVGVVYQEKKREKGKSAEEYDKKKVRKGKKESLGKIGRDGCRDLRERTGNKRMIGRNQESEGGRGRKN